MFSQDRDLVIFEPALLRDVAWAGQRRLSTIASISSTTLTLDSGSFTDAQIQPGHTALFDAITLEIISIDSPTTATVSLMRADLTSQTVPPVSAESRGLTIHDFSPQRAVVHAQILAMLALDPAGESAFGIDESAITNPNALRRLETLGTLAMIYAGAAPPGSNNDRFTHRADMYRSRFMRERESVIVALDTDADGIAETTRRPNMASLQRG